MTEEMKMPDVTFDPHNLIESWQTQGPDYLEWGNAWANATFERDEAKRNEKRIKGELADRARNPDTMEGPAKTTDAAIASWVEGHPELDAARKLLNEWNLKVNRLDKVLNAFQDRSLALNNVTKLFLQGYYQSKTPVSIGERKALERSAMEEPFSEKTESRLKKTKETEEKEKN
jgi:hypothetical protein